MRIAIMGAGALGGYFGGRLAAAGYDVSFVARGQHLAAMQANGLRINSPNGDLVLPKVNATDKPAEIGPVDVVMFMVKNQDLQDAARAMTPMMGKNTMVTTFQNGVSAPQQLGEIIGADRVVPGVARIPASVSEPGVIRHGAPNDLLVFGEMDGTVSDRCRKFDDALRKAGTTPKISNKITHELWSKFIGQSVLASVTALTRLDVGPLRENAATKRLSLDAMQETERVGRAVVPDLPANLVQFNWDFWVSLPPTMHASMLDDLQRGKRLETDYMSGEVVRLGRLHGVATPIHDVFHAALQPFVNGAPV